MRKWLLLLTAIVGSIVITMSFDAPLQQIFSLSQGNLLEFSSVNCDSLSTSEIDASCLSLAELPEILLEGQTYTLSVIDPKGNSVKEGCKFSVNAPNIASIDPNGQIKALSAGNAIITIEHVSGYIEIIDLTVEPKTPVLVDDIKITLLDTRKTVTQGDRFTISVKVTPKEFSNKVTFFSSDATIASIDSEGMIKALMPGKVTIKAQVEGSSASFVLEVLKKNELIKLQSLEIVSASTTMEIATAQQLTVKKSPADANETIEFISSDSSILAVSSSGKITAKAVGSATVTVRNSSNSVTSSVTIRVVNTLEIERLIKEVFRLTNKERVNAGLPALTYSDTLQKGAMIRAEEIIQSFSHTRPDGSKFYTVFNGAYPYRMIGENLAAGFTSASSVVEGWMNSEGHRANILKDGYTQIGIGVKKDKDGRIYWVQIFGDPK
ncbi:MAG: hypothetical protein CVU94_03365 [Firmicutes bacterium HGW-Firmicutes-19]|jgi:uncharacterized protein YkwD|nr:MAG: hypothetical protein CVU94_03365 [Firmicutes bacterium HGW-Firmicutes-19]